MPSAFAEKVMLSDVERQLAVGHRWLKFASAIETTFVSETRTERLHEIVVTTIAAIILYNIFLVNDWTSLHDRFGEMVIARLFIFTPVLLGFIALAHYAKSAATQEWLGALGGVLAVFLPMTVMVFSDSTHKLSYQYGSVLVMTFSTVIQRIRFRPAVIAVAGMLVIQLTTTYVSKAFDTQTYVAIVTFFGAAAALQLVALYIMESAGRRTFLFALRGRLLRDQLQLTARIDALTGLFNRRHLADFIADTWACDERRPVSAILLDIDHFKLFNDSCGHLQGDDCLRSISACIMQTIANCDGAGFRFGGEEMLVLLPGAEPSEACCVADKIRRALADIGVPHPALGEHAKVTASFGIAGVIAPDISAADLIAAADTALYAAKRAGRNCIWPPVPQKVPAVALSRPAASLKCA